MNYCTNFNAVARLRRSLAGLSSWRSGFYHRPIRLGLIVDKMTE